MTTPKILFDEGTLGGPLLDVLRNALRYGEPDEQAEIKHVIDFQLELGLGRQGVWDENWIPEVSAQGWSVISSDRGKRGGVKKGQKLPKLCVQYGITHVLLTGKTNTRRKFKKLLTILSVWHDIIRALTESQPGSRFVIEAVSNKPEAVGRGKLVRRQIPPSETLPPGILFEK